MGLRDLVANWFVAAWAAIAAALLGYTVPLLTVVLLPRDRGDLAIFWLFTSCNALSAFGGVLAAYVATPTRPLLFASAVFVAGGLIQVWLSVKYPDQVAGLLAVLLSGSLGGALALGLGVVRECMRAMVPNKPLQPTSGGHAPGEGGSMGRAARG